MSNAPLTAAEIEEIKALVGNHYTTWESDDKEAAATYLARLLSMLTPPPDAAVREAVERLDNSEYTISLDGSQDDTKQMWEDIDTLIAHARAPRLTAEQREAVKALYDYAERNICSHDETHRGGIWEICDNCGAKWADDEGGKPEWKEPKELTEARAAFPELAWEVRNVE